MSPSLRRIGTCILIALACSACTDDAPTPDERVPEDAPHSSADVAGALPGTSEVVPSKSDEPSSQAPVRVVSGTVLGPNDELVEGAEVSLFEVQSPWPFHKVRRIDAAYSGPDGEFRFRAPRGADLVVEVLAERLAVERVAVPVEVGSITIRMSYGYLLTGIVRTATNSLARDCEVLLEPGYLEDDPARLARTDDAGRFWFDHVPPGRRRVTARSDLFQPVSTMVAVGASGPIQLSLDRAAINSRGRVIDARTRRPVAGAEVRAYPGAWNAHLHPPTVASTDADGEFELPGLGQTNLNFEVHHPDYSVASRGVAVARKRSEIEFELSPRVTLSGRLRGDDVTSVAIRIRTEAGEFERVVTDADGGFRFAGLSLGLAELEIERGRLAFETSTGRFMSVALEDIELQREFAVTAPTVVRGRVLDEAGAGIDGVLVRTPLPIQRQFSRTLAVTDAEGRFEFAGARVGALQITMHHDGHAASVATVEILEVGDHVVVDDVVMLRDGRLEGLVLRDGVPAVGAAVYAARPHQSFTAVTGPDGRYVIRGVAPGRYRIKARDSTMPFVSHPDSVEVVSGRTTEVEPFRLEAGRRVTGVVFDQADRPVAGALVFVPSSLSTAYTDDGGRFELDVAPDVEELQVWSADQRVHVTERIRRGHLEIRLDTVPRRTVRARVLGLPSRRPISRAVLRVTANRADPTWEQALSEQRDIPSMAVEMVNGSLVVELPIGQSHLELSCQGFAPFATDLELEPDQTQPHDLGTILLEPGAKVRGRVVNAAGLPIPGAAVWLGREIDRFQPKFRVQVRSDSDGRFALEGVSPRNRDLIVASEGVSTALYQIRIPADLIAEEPFTVEMQPASLIEVQVVDAGGRPTENGVVRLQKDGFTMAFSYPDTTGRARFMAPSAGEYVLELFGEGVSESLFVGQRPDRYELTLQSGQ